MRAAAITRAILTSTVTLATLLILQTATAMSQGLSRDIGPQPLARALEVFAAETGLQLVYRSEIAAGIASRGARAGLSAEEALRELLRETGLTFEFLNKRTIAIHTLREGSDEPKARGGDALAPTVAQESVRFSQAEQEPPPAGAGNSQPQEVPEPRNQSLLNDIGELLVTGSRIKRAQLEGPAPVITITSEQMAREGYTTAYEALYSLTQQTGSGLQTQFSPNGATANATNVDLRGLGPGRVLVLFNGRRAADYPLPFNGQSNIVNLSAIPTAALDRIEVLSSGASAIYGSDAVSGVINFVMRNSFEGVQLDGRLGGTSEGGGTTRRVRLTGGVDGDALKGVYAFEYFDRDPIWALDRDAFDNNNDRPEGLPVQDTFVMGLVGLAGFIAPPAATGGCANFGRDVRLSPAVPSVPALGNICSSRDLQAQRTIRHDTEDKSGFFNATYDFANGLQLFGTASVWQSDSKFHTQLGPNTLFLTPLLLDATPGVTRDLGGLAAGQYLQFIRFFQINEMPDPDLMFDERAWDAVLGLRGSLFEDSLEWELAYHHSDYDVERDQRTPLTEAIFDFYFGPQLRDASGNLVFDNLLGMLGIPLPPAAVYTAVNRGRMQRALTPAEWRSITALNHTEAQSSNDQASAVLTGSLFSLPAGEVGFAAVLEWGTQSYGINLDPRLTAGEFYGLTEFPGGGVRHRYAAGLELAVPVLDSVRLTLASRYDKYNDITDVDDAVTYNAGVEYRPFKSLLFRGAYATSFRAPDMHFVFAAPSSLFAAPLDELRCRRDLGITDPAQCAVAIPPVIVEQHRRGNPGLQEETGKSWSAGVVWNVLDSLDLTVDYFDIRLDDIVNDLSFDFILSTEADCRIGRTVTGEAVDSGSALCQFAMAQVVRNPFTGPGTDRLIEVNTGPINRSLQNVRGLDATLNYSLDTERLGDFRFNLAWSHILEQERQEFATDPVDSYRDDPDNLDLRSRVRGTVSWRMGRWAHTLLGDRRGSRPTFDELARTKSYTTYNYSTVFSATPALTFSLVVNNLLDEDPRIDDTFSAYPFFYQSNVNPVGREAFFEVGYRFR